MSVGERLRRNYFRVTLVAIVVTLYVLPFVVPESLLGTSRLGILINIVVLALFALSFNFLFARTGLLSFGHAAYYGAGAYLVGILLAGSIPFVPGVDSFLLAGGLSVLATTVIAAVFGVFCVRRGHFFFAMLTLAFNMLLYISAIQFDNITGGSNGLIISNRTINFGIMTFSASDLTAFYVFVLTIVLFSMYAFWRIYHSPYGELLVTIRDNPERAEFIGIPTFYYKWTSFIISGSFAGIAGVLISAHSFVVEPGILHWSASADPVFASLIGGPYTFFGPIVGAVIFVLIREVMTSVTQHWHIGVGIILVFIVLFARQGILGTLKERQLLSRDRTPKQTIDPNDD